MGSKATLSDGVLQCHLLIDDYWIKYAMDLLSNALLSLEYACMHHL